MFVKLLARKHFLCLFIVFCSVHVRAAAATPLKVPSSVKNIQNQVESAKSLQILSRIYISFGEYNKALTYSKRALGLSSNQLQSASNRMDLAVIHNSLGNFDKASEHCRLAYQSYKKVYGQSHSHIATILRTWAASDKGNQHYLLAEEKLKRAITMIQQDPLSAKHQTAPIYVEIAELKTLQGNLEQAHRLFTDAYKNILSSYGPNHLYTAQVSLLMAKMYLARNQYDLAEEFIMKSLKIQKDVFQTDHPMMMKAWLVQADISKARQNFSQAELILKKALKVVENKYGSNHPMHGHIISDLSDLFGTRTRIVKNDKYPTPHTNI